VFAGKRAVPILLSLRASVLCVALFRNGTLVSRERLQTYVIGREQFTGRRVDVVEVRNQDKDDAGVVLHEKVDVPLIEEIRVRLRKAGDAIGYPKLRHLPVM